MSKELVFNGNVLLLATVFIVPGLFVLILSLFTTMRFRKYGVYGFLAAFLKGKEAKSVTEEHVLEAIKKKNIAEAVEVFSETEVGRYLSERIMGITSYSDLEKNLWNYATYDISYIQKYLPADASLLLDNYMVKYDILNIKQVLRRLLEKSTHKTQLIPLGLIYKYGLLRKLDEATSIDELVEIVKSVGLYDYATVIEDYIKKLTSEVNVKNVRMELEKKLDETYYSKMLGLAFKLRGREQILPALGSYLDLLNIDIVIRGIISKDYGKAAKLLLNTTYTVPLDFLREMLELRNLEEVSEKLAHTPYAEVGRKIVDIYKLTSDILLVEKTIIDYAMKKFKENVSTAILTPAVLLHYLLAKEKEIKLLLLTFRIIEEKLPSEKYVKFLKEVT